MDAVSASRFLPRKDVSKKEDFRFVKGPVKVYSYLTSRRNSGGALRLLAEEAADAPAPEVLGALEGFSVQLQGAVSNFAFAALSVGISMLALTA